MAKDKGGRMHEALIQCFLAWLQGEVLLPVSIFDGMVWRTKGWRRPMTPPLAQNPGGVKGMASDLQTSYIATNTVLAHSNYSKGVGRE